MISIKNVCKTIQDKQILKDVNIEVERGSIFGLIGPNGAGKTTLIKGLTGIYRMENGEIKVDGKYVFENPSIKKYIGYVSDDNNFFASLKVKNLKKFYKLTYKTFDSERFKKLNEIFKIPEERLVSRLSKGMKMRLELMLTLSIGAKVLVLDEPTNGLDPIIKKKLMNLILDEVSRKQTTVFISSHNLSDIERICDKIAIINEGKILYCSSIDQMKESIRKIQVVFKEKAPSDMEKWDEVLHVENIGRVYSIITRGNSEKFKGKLSEIGTMFQEKIDLSLEDMFIYSIKDFEVKDILGEERGQ